MSVGIGIACGVHEVAVSCHSRSNFPFLPLCNWSVADALGTTDADETLAHARALSDWIAACLFVLYGMANIYILAYVAADFHSDIGSNARESARAFHLTGGSDGQARSAATVASGEEAEDRLPPKNV